MSEETIVTEQNNTEVSEVESAPVFNPNKPEGDVQKTEPTEPMVTDEKKIEEPAIVGAPEQYADFNFPEGSKVDQEILDKFKSFAKESNMGQDRAQKLIDLGNELTAKANEHIENSWKDLRSGWVDSLKTDKEFGGMNFDKTITRAKRTLGKFGDDTLVEFLDQGMGDNAGLIKMLAKIDKALSEDSIVDGGKSKESPRSYAEIIYGKQ